jgi:hypothetical protein
MTEMLERYNNALGTGGNAGDIISNPSVEVIVEPVERSDDADSLIGRITVSDEVISEDSSDIAVIMRERRKRLMNIQFCWMFSMFLTFVLLALQIVLYLGAKK